MNKICDEFDQHVDRLFTKPVARTGRLRQGRINHAVLGITSEAGEIADAIKKSWIYGAHLDPENILEEAGDVMFYISGLLREFGFSTNDAMLYNITKLKKRYPDGYTDEAALARADKK